MTADELNGAARARPSVHVRRVARRAVFVLVIVLQVAFVMRAYWAPHMEFGFQMFSEASAWQARIVRVTVDGQRVAVTEPWSGYEWAGLVDDPGLADFDHRHHADGGVDNQLALLDEALEWVAANTPVDTETRFYEATVTTWFNGDPPLITVHRSSDRELP